VIILDTNVVSELVKPTPSPAVIGWIDMRDSSDLVITALTAAEVRAGVAVLPDGRRKREFALRMESLLTDTFAGFVLSFTIDSSAFYAQILAARKKSGQPISTFDAQIAAVCLQHEATLATRNIADFTATRIELINPWETG
jgi:predicted nucleic acid-binding protein